MKKYLVTPLLALALMGSSAQAAVLTIDMPGDNLPFTTTVGAFFDANVYINSIADFGGFDLSVSYSTTKLQAVSLTSAYVFGETETETLASDITPGLVHFAEAISFESSLDAGLAINAPTLLGTVRFKALNTGINNLVDIFNPVISSFSGDPVGGTKQGAFVTINQAPVPLPASLYLFGSALLAGFRLRKKT